MMQTGFYIRCRCCRKFFSHIDQWAYKGATYSTEAKDRFNFIKDIENAHVYDRLQDAQDALKKHFNNRTDFTIIDHMQNIVFEPG